MKAGQAFLSHGEKENSYSDTKDDCHDTCGSGETQFAVKHSLTHTHTHVRTKIDHIRWWDIAGQVALYKQAYPTPYSGHLFHVICVSDINWTHVSLLIRFDICV